MLYYYEHMFETRFFGGTQPNETFFVGPPRPWQNIRTEMLDVKRLWPSMPEEYAENLTLWPNHIPPSEYNLAVQEQIRQGINAGKLVGAAALRAMGSMGEYNQAFHGSNVLPEDLEGGVLQPRQAYWRHGTTNKRFKDGNPAICFTRNAAAAVTLGLLHPRGRTDENLYLSFGVTPKGTERRITSKASIEAAAGKTACLYTIDFIDPKDFIIIRRSKRETEYRKETPTPYIFAARIQTDTLPPDLLVVDCNERDKLDNINEDILSGASPLAVSHKYGVDISPWGNTWDVNEHPALLL